MTKALKSLAVSAVALSLFAAIVPVSFGESVLKKPIVKQSAIGAAAGVAVGALSDRATVGKSAATGAVVGAGTGLMSQSKYLKDKPLLRNTLQGAAVGTGVSYATGKSKVEGAVVGAGSGAGYRLLKNYIDKK
jgi:hypothetical protein